MNALDGLNTEQRNAVEAPEGPVSIVAGPGTGKTKTLTARIVHLVASGQASPEEILALTFTNKAAREMRERVQQLLPGRQLPVMSTFHALAQRLLADTADARQLISEAERAELLAGIKKDRRIKGLSVRDLNLLVSRAKNRLEPSDDPVIRDLVTAYNLELAARSRYDFDDLLLRLHDLLQQGPPLAYRHILVDEFQDTNELQYALLALLDTTGSLFVIGDPLQSIYGFRGASAAVFDRFSRDWPAATAIVLTTNYRSAPQIVRMAAAVFPNAPQLQAHRTQPGVAQAVEVLNEYSEADWIINEIERQVGGSDMLRGSKHHADDRQRTFGDFAILYRTHAVAKTIQRALESAGIPYQVAGEGSPYEQPHIQTITQALAYIADKGDAPRIKSHTASQIEALLAPLKETELSLPELVSRIIELFDLASEKHTISLRQFTNSLVPFEDKPLAAYIEYLASIAEQEYYDPAADKVTLLTIHAAKGLEFSRVFLIAAEEGILPHEPKGKKNAAADNEEERRLFYVAVTRARDELYLLHVHNRGGEQRQVSRFVASLPADIVERIVDPSLENQKRRIERRQQKRSQTSLF